MMLRLLFALVIFGTLISSRVLAGPTLIGSGGVSCGAWTAAERTHSNEGRRQWLLGWVSAYNFYQLQLDGADISKGTDANGLFAWVDNFCAAHPLDQLATAAIRLVEALQQRSK